MTVQSDEASAAGLPSNDPEPWRVRLDQLLERADHEGALCMTRAAMRRLRSRALMKGEPFTWLVRIHADRGNRVELARALLTTGSHTYGDVPGLWTGPHLDLVPDEHIEAIRRRTGPNSRRYYDDMFHGNGVPPVLLRALGVPLSLDNLGWRALQGYGALCLAHFCAAKEIFAPSIGVLVLHLVDSLLTENSPDWDEASSQLDLSGRGDPLPPPLDAIEPESLRNTFHLMVEYAVEIGIGDLYGASTEGPHLDCAILLETMERAGVTPPPIPAELYDAEVRRPTTDANRAAHQRLHAACQALLAP